MAKILAPLKNRVIGHVFAISNWSAVIIIDVCLWLGDPGLWCTGPNYEVGAPSYHSVYTFSNTWGVTSYSAFNLKVIKFHEAQEDWGEVTHAVLKATLLGGDKHPWISCALSEPTFIGKGYIPYFDENDFSVTFS